ncbi:hypothetical protein [Oceanicaulis sp.]|uniref:hypothetical protein n=1 Tax=Oceanicaulis sp. TaxID=1924941 RepID=UPI003D28F066
MADGLERVVTLFNDTIDLALITLFTIAGLIGFLPGVQKRWSYAGAALVMGVGLGVAVRWAPFLPPGCEIIGVILGVVCGPATAAAWKGKTLSEAIDDIRAMKRGGGDAG